MKARHSLSAVRFSPEHRPQSACFSVGARSEWECGVLRLGLMRLRENPVVPEGTRVHNWALPSTPRQRKALRAGLTYTVPSALDFRYAHSTGES